MRLPRILPGLGSLLAAAALVLPAIVQAGPQWSGIKGRAVLEQFILAPPLTNHFGIPTAVSGFSASTNYVTVRSPIKTVIRVYQAKSGRFVRTVNTDDSGRFVALLQPGRYRLEPAIMRDGHVLEGDAILMGLNQLLQTAPSQVVGVGGFRYSQVSVVYRTTWPPPVRQIPSRPIRTAPVTGPVGNFPLPQPGEPTISSGAMASISGRTFPPRPPTPFAPPDSPLAVPQTPLPISQR